MNRYAIKVGAKNNVDNTAPKMLLNQFVVNACLKNKVR